jgi:hypothetical protein
METITISKEEYERLKEIDVLLHDNELLKKLNRLIELLLAEKWGIVMPDDTSDLIEANFNNVTEWKTERNVWDNI